MSFLPLATLSASSSSRHRQSAPSRSRAAFSVFDLDIDVETAALIAKLQLEDIEDSLSRRKGKGRARAVLSDEEYAIQVQREQYEELLTVAQDAKIAASLRGAVETDIAYIEALMLAEEAAREDRRAAEMLSRGEQLPPQKDCQIRLETPGFIMHPEPPKQMLDDKGSEKTVAVVDSDDEDVLLSDDDDTVFGDFDSNKQAAIVNSVKIRNSFSKNSVAPGPSINRNKKVHCIICNDTLPYVDALQTPCNHNYCKDCIRSLVELCTRDESLFPIRCCQTPIPITNIFPFIAIGLRRLFEAKHAEFSVLSKDRVYCVSPTCSAFLGSGNGSTGTEMNCPQCGMSTCPQCKQAGHPNDPDCSVNKSTIELRALARREGWQTCPGCYAVVELNVGCYHMTCRCRTEFCYLCAVPWKGCQCPQWEEARLVAAAQQRVENEMGPQAVRNVLPNVFAERVQQRVETLRDNHHCDRHNWTYRHGGGRCEECHFNLPNFLLVRVCLLLPILFTDQILRFAEAAHCLPVFAAAGTGCDYSSRGFFPCEIQANL
ncbi:unnamed protein product [Cyclocybe aegerita]|uniref:RBR-type E3 ubiquitin transferase n=1 Tax=Cyclocybe aegerita TaxID=1973307 RepID=A0A8S0VZR8_CYCAE|nr:unnamed protein product [Cyclocybe aegerita]